MITGVEVLDKIREMSRRTVSSRRRILLSAIATELSMPQDALLVLLAELKNRGLIKIHKTPVVSVSLTGYGIAEEDPQGGIDS